MGKLKDIECMRVITMIFVIFAHVTRMYTDKAAIPQGVNNSFVTLLTEWIYTFHMPAFVAISGAVYYFVKRERKAYNNTKSFIYNKIKRLLIPYIFFSIFIVLPTLYYCDLINFKLFDWYNNLVFILSGPRHLWYVIMLFNLLVIFNFFEKFIFRYKVIFMILCFLIYPFSSYIPGYFQLQNVFHYLLYFMIGYFFQSKRLYVNNIINTDTKKTLLFLLSFFISVIIYSISYFINLNNIAISLLCSILGIVFMYFLSALLSEREKIYSNFLFKLIDKNNFGLYLFHPMIIYVIFWNIRDFDLDMWFSIFLVFFLSMFISIILTILMRTMHLNIFIGEKLK